MAIGGGGGPGHQQAVRCTTKELSSGAANTPPNDHYPKPPYIQSLLVEAGLSRLFTGGKPPIRPARGPNGHFLPETRREGADTHLRVFVILQGGPETTPLG